MMISWTIYDHPSDFPNTYVARRFVNAKPSTSIIEGDLEDIRVVLQEMGLICFQRSPSDDPKIVETWL